MADKNPRRVYRHDDPEVRVVYGMRRSIARDHGHI
jgi:hypothetical protein